MDDISKKIISSIIEFMSVSAQNSIHLDAGINEIGDSSCYFSGCEFPFFNGVFNNHQFQDNIIRDNFPEIIKFFNEKNVSFIWWWIHQSSLPSEIKKELDENQFKFLGEFYGVAARTDEIDLSFNQNEDVTIKLVDTKKEYKKSLEIVCEVFQLSDSVKYSFESMFQPYGNHQSLRHYLGFYKNEPVASLTSYINDGTVGLYNGATLAKARNAGVCSMLAQEAIKDAIKLNCEYVVAQLMATAMAKGLTEKLGMKVYCKLMPFLKEIK